MFFFRPALIFVLFACLSLHAQNRAQSSPQATDSAKLAAIEAKQNAEEKLISTQAKEIQALSDSVGHLMEAMQHMINSQSSITPKTDLSRVKSDLAGYENYCTEEQNKALAYEQTAGRSLEGAAAMNCAQRLKSIVEELVEALDR